MQRLLPTAALRWFVDRVPPIAWLMLLAAVVIGAGIGLRDPWPADEPRFALIARDMVETGQWFFPRVAGVLYPDKPPVFFWLIAVCHAVTGSLRIAFLLPSLLAGLGMLWLVHDLGRRLWNARVGVYAAAILLVTLQFTLQARSGQIDAVLAFWTTLGIYGFCRHLLLGPSWGWYVTGFAAAGAGVITKGVGILPLLIFIPWAFARARHWHTLRPLGGGWRWVAGPLAMLAVIACWLVPMLWLVHASGDPAFAAYRDNILFRQTAERYADAWHHIKPFWYYLIEVVPLFWLPVTLVLPWLVPAWRRDLRARDARILLLLGWVLLVLVFFSISPGKRGVYVLPAVPALALACAPHAGALLKRRGVQRAGFVLLALLAMIWLATLLHFQVLHPEAGAALVARHGVAPWGVIGAFAFTAVAWLSLRPRHGLYALCGHFLTLWLIYGLVAYPLLNDARSPARMMARVAQRIGPQAELGLVDWKEQFVLHAGRPIVHFGFRRPDVKAETADALQWLAAGDRRYLLLPRDAVTPCLRESTLRHVDFAHRQEWLLATEDSVDVDCLRRRPVRRAHAPVEYAVTGKEESPR